MSHHHAETVMGVTAKAAPPLTVVMGAAVGIDWQTIVWQLTAVYLVVLTAKILWDWFVKPVVLKPPK